MILWKWPIFRPSARPTNSYSLRSYRIGRLSIEFESKQDNDISRDGFSNFRGAEKKPDYCLGAAKRGKKVGGLRLEMWKYDIMMHHDASWCIMVHHDASWCIMMHQDASCSIMMHHDASWCIMMHQDASWCIRMHHDASWSMEESRASKLIGY